MDNLYNAAQFYHEYLEGETFEIVFAKNQKAEKIDLQFSPSNFFHLAGLAKLVDIVWPVSKNKVLENILSQTIFIN